MEQVIYEKIYYQFYNENINLKELLEIDSEQTELLHGIIYILQIAGVDFGLCFEKMELDKNNNKTIVFSQDIIMSINKIRGFNPIADIKLSNYTVAVIDYIKNNNRYSNNKIWVLALLEEAKKLEQLEVISNEEDSVRDDNNYSYNFLKKIYSFDFTKDPDFKIKYDQVQLFIDLTLDLPNNIKVVLNEASRIIFSKEKAISEYGIVKSDNSKFPSIKIPYYIYEEIQKYKEEVVLHKQKIKR